MWLCQITLLVAVIDEQNALSSALVISILTLQKDLYKKKIKKKTD